ncbi:pectin lyase fold/virulence factor [Baffinella frigidus]|nr:pectin lyase fold/virulence factor [Cryptophyta sp. CCMP2293]
MDAERLKDPDYSSIDLMYHTSRARVISDYGASNFLVSGSGIEICGLTIVQRLAYKDMQGDMHKGLHAMCAVDVASGSATFRECHISSDAGIGIKVHSGASPTFVKCHVSYCKYEGVWIGDGSTGRVEESRLFSNYGANLHIESNAHPVVHRCKIFQSHSCGVRVTDKGKGLLTQNEIYECQSANVRVDDQAQPIPRHSLSPRSRLRREFVLVNARVTGHADAEANCPR